jgi:hypothetical protein
VLCGSSGSWAFYLAARQRVVGPQQEGLWMGEIEPKGSSDLWASVTTTSTCIVLLFGGITMDLLPFIVVFM